MAPSTTAEALPSRGAMVAGEHLGTVSMATSQPGPRIVLGANLTHGTPPHHPRIKPSALYGL